MDKQEWLRQDAARSFRRAVESDARSALALLYSMCSQTTDPKVAYAYGELIALEKVVIALSPKEASDDDEA